jgi:hypothetical protein
VRKASSLSYHRGESYLLFTAACAIAFLMLIDKCAVFGTQGIKGGLYHENLNQLNQNAGLTVQAIDKRIAAPSTCCIHQDE